MECARNYYCRCCYHAGELEMLSDLALDVYTLIYHPRGLKDDAAQIFACFRCRKFLEEVYYFRDERCGDKSGNPDFKPHEEIIDEDVKMDQIDIQIIKIEAHSNPDTSQQMAETSRESLFVSNLEKSEVEDHNSPDTYENNLLIESRAITYIETNKSTNRPLKKLGKVHKKNCDRPFKCNECSFESPTLSKLKNHTLFKHSDEKPFTCDQCDYRAKVKSNLTAHMKKHLPYREKSFKCNECSYEAMALYQVKHHILQKHSDARPFSCDHCGFRCKTKPGIYKHMNIHMMYKRFQCNECSYRTITPSKLKNHILHKHSDERPYSCDRCDSRFKTQPDVSIHMKTHLTDHDKPFQCNYCSYRTIKSNRLKCHILRKHSDERPFSCNQCDFRFKTNSDLSKHMKRHDKSFKCNECSYGTDTLNNLKNHILHKHSDERPYSCNRCHYRFKTQFDVHSHMKTHLPDRDKPFQCNECSFGTITSARLKCHIFRKHSDERPYSCDHCDSRFKTKFDVHSHMQTHLTKRDKPFQCNECSYKTITSSKLKLHILRKHSDERPFSCDQCGSRFKTSSDLSNHIKRRLTKGDKSFKCNECSYGTNTLSNLKKHILHKHSKESPYSCDQCDSRFKMKSSLTLHMNTHLAKRDKPFQCNECSYGTISSSHLKNHILHKHNKERAYSCDQCDSRFKTKSCLFKHNKRHLKS